MIKKTVRWLKWICYISSLDDLSSDIETNKSDFTKHKFTFRKGTIWFRFVYPGNNPIIPTGLETRFVSQSPDFIFGLHRPTEFIGSTCSTAATGYLQTYSLAFKEADNADIKDQYKITLLEDIELTDMDSICKARRVPKPYMTKDWHPVFDLFYGQQIKGLRCESAEDQSDYTFVIYHKWFPEFEKIIKTELIKKAKRNSMV